MPTFVTFYDGQNLTGDPFGPHPVGTYDWPFVRDEVPNVNWNDRISSIEIPSGMQVTVCRDFLIPAVPTDCTIFVGDQLTLDPPFDNSISSFVIALIP